MNKSALWAWLAICIPIAVLFGPALVTDRSFVLRDAGHFYYPLFEWCCREWAAGRVPLWNPYENCGVPVLADTTSSVVYPGKLLFLLPLDFAVRYKLYITLHVLLAAAGSYVLARNWKTSPPAAALAAITYACGGNVVFQYCNVVFLVGAAWLPFATLASDRMLRRSSWQCAILLGLILALMILGGDPQAAYHALTITILYASVLALAPPADESPSWRARLRRFAGWTGLTGLAAAAALLLAAIQVLPSAEATRYSERAAFNRPRNIYEAAFVVFQPDSADHPLGETRMQSITRGLFAEPETGSHHDLAYDFSVGPWRLAEYFWPNISGRMFPTHRRWLSLVPAEGRTWTPTLYMGLLPVVLAIGSIRLWTGTRRHRWLSIVIILFTFASFGYYGLGWLLREVYGTVLRQEATKLSLGAPVGGLYWLFVTLLPTYVYFRYPAKLLTIVSLGLSQLAACSFDTLLTRRQPRLSVALVILGGGSGTLAFVLWCIGPALFSGIKHTDASLGPFDVFGAYHDVLFALIQTASVALVGRWVLARAWTQPDKLPQWKLLAVLLTAVDVAAANYWLVATAPADIWRGESPIAEAIRSKLAEDSNSSAPPSRIFRSNLASWRPAEFRRTRSADRPAELARWERDTLFPKYPLTSSLALVESYGSIKLADHESLLYVAKQHGPRQTDGTLLPQPTALRLLGTDFLVAPENQHPVFASQFAKQDAHWPSGAVLMRMNATLPRAWIVHKVEVLPPLAAPPRMAALDERADAVLFPNNRPRDFSSAAVAETANPHPEWNSTNIPKNVEASTETAHITHYEPQRIAIEAQLNEPGLLILSDTWYPGWRASVTTNGRTTETPIYRTNRILRGVQLPAGNHTVEFRYRPLGFTLGAVISSCSWLMLIAALVIRTTRRRPN